MKTMQIPEIAQILRDARRMVILQHVHPDGDTTGCGMALKIMAEAMGKYAICRGAETVGARLEFLLWKQDSLVGEWPEDVDLVLSIDVASPQQLGSLAERIPQISFMMDHHSSGTPYAPVLLRPEAAAAAEIVYELYRYMREQAWIPELPEACVRLYAALMDDTGNMKYSNVTLRTFQTAGELAQIINGSETALKTADISRLLFDSRYLETLQADALVTGKVRLYEKGKLAVSVITNTDRKTSGLKDADFADSVNIPRSIHGVEVGLLLRQQPDDPSQYRVSSRSNGGADVGAVCAQFGGGGHSKAAGCTLSAASEEEAYEKAAEAFGLSLGKENG